MIRRHICGLPVNGEADAVSEPLRRIERNLAGLPVEARGIAWSAFLCGRPDADAVILDLASVDPSGPFPAEGPPRRAAHLGDLSEANNTGRFVWPRWVVRAHFTLLTSEPKVGKTRLGLELAKRLWLGLPWPDGQPASFPAGTKTMWICGDRNQDELREIAGAYGLPPEAVLLNASPDEPYGGVSLDDPDNVAALRDRVQAERPGLVFIDTVWRSTRRKLCREDEVNALMDPILAIAQDLDVPTIGMMHASKDGETLGRRLEGLARAVIKLSKPDPEGQPARRKFWVDRANFLEPAPLGVTMHAEGCDFDFDPPEEAPKVSGRPKGVEPKLDAAIAFLQERLSEADRKQCELINEWEDRKESKGTLFNAFRAMKNDGLLVIDDSRKPKVCHLVKKTTEVNEEVF